MGSGGPIAVFAAKSRCLRARGGLVVGASGSGYERADANARSDANAHRDDRHGLCRPGFRHLPRRFRPSCDLRRQGPGQDRRLLAGRMPIWEPGLEALVKANVERGRLAFTTDLAKALEGAEAVFIAVGTPSRRGDGHADLSFVFAAVEELAGLLDQARSWWSPSRPCRSGPATRSPPCSRKRARPRDVRWRPILSSCAKARRSPTSSIPIASWSAPRTTRHARCWPKSTGRCSSIGRRCCSPGGGRPS